jgi:hypothetical protein
MKALRVAVAGAGYFCQFQLDGWRRLPGVELSARGVYNVVPLTGISRDGSVITMAATDQPGAYCFDQPANFIVDLAINCSWSL